MKANNVFPIRPEPEPEPEPKPEPVSKLTAIRFRREDIEWLVSMNDEDLRECLNCFLTKFPEKEVE